MQTTTFSLEAEMSKTGYYSALQYKWWALTKCYFRRLNKQHEYITEAVFDGRLIFKNNTKLRPGMKVLDSATGTGKD